MPTNTYVALDKVTVGTATPSITFSSIPSTYTDLVVVCANITNASAQTMYVRFNGDTTTNYSATYLSGDGSSASSARQSNQAAGILIGGVNVGLSSTVPANAIIQIQNYANTTTFKTALSRYNLSSAELQAVVGMWRSTSAITSMDIRVSGGNFAVGSTFSLYGIAAASVGAKATGGTIYSDSQYFYHVFAASGTFTPTQSITADCLVVAGGGGGGADMSGGGGAGGLLGFTSQSLTATGYTVTVGAGGAGGSSGGALGANGANSQFGGLTASVGGGRSGNYITVNGASGGSGGGAGRNAGGSSGGAGTSGQGFAGGGGSRISSDGETGGGGGAGAVGQTGGSGFSGDGGVGSSAYSSWGLATGTGQNSGGTYYYAGGGGGGWQDNSTVTGSGGLGGGGNGAAAGIASTAGTANTGGGGGGGAGGGSLGRSGGSGIVIIRYLKA